MNMLQEDYGTRLMTVGIEGSTIAELFAVGRDGFMGAHHVASGPLTLNQSIQRLLSAGVISQATAKHLHTLRQHGNHARHPTADDIKPEHKPAVAAAVFAVATVVNRALAVHP